MVDLTEKQQAALSNLSLPSQNVTLSHWSKIQSLVDQFGEPTTLDELATTVIKLINYKLELDNNRVIGFSWNIHYNQSVSNSHSHPVFGVGNWSRDSTKPVGYPGYQGRVWIRYEKSPKCIGSDYFILSKTHPGSGGSGYYNGPWTKICEKYYRKYGHKSTVEYPSPITYSWDYQIYLEDWILLDECLKKEREQATILGALKGSRIDSKYRSHLFLWTDPEVAHADEEFIKQTQSELT